MNDRFKFRYVYNNEIYNVLAIDFSNQTANLVRLDNKEELFMKIDVEKLIQCVGCKDLNKKDIYEGDIVKDTEYRLDTIYKIGFKKGAFFLENNCYIAYFHELRRCFSENRLEIIGNIYTTPELLEGKE